MGRPPKTNQTGEWDKDEFDAGGLRQEKVTSIQQSVNCNRAHGKVKWR